ncbi:unnamed protein product [Closterium sp. NIES-53]
MRPSRTYSVLIQDEPEYEVERVLTHRRRDGKTLEFLLRWKGYDPTEDSWVAEADMGNAHRVLKDYLVKQGEEEKVFLLVYVDNILLFSPSLERIKKVQGKLKKAFQCKALGPVGYYLGLHVERDEVKGWLRLHQHKYLAAMGEKYGLEEGRSVKIPLPSGFQLHLDEEEGEVLEYELQRQFQSMFHSSLVWCLGSFKSTWKQQGVEEVSTKTGQPARGDLVAPPTWLHWVVSYRYPVEPPAASLRSLPGASRVAQHTEDNASALGFVPSTADPSLFLRTSTLLPPFYVLVYVDNLVFATADTEALAHMKSELQKRHTCTDLGKLRSYLGLQITRDRARRTITLTQSHMVHQVLQRFDFRYSSPQSTPLPIRHSLSAPPSDESVEPSGPYPELVGCLMYLMTCTRPGLAYPLSILTHYVAHGRH